MAVGSVKSYYEYLQNKSPVVTAGSTKTNTTNSGPGVQRNDAFDLLQTTNNQTTQSPGPAATIVSPSNTTSNVVTAGSGKSSGNNASQYLTDYSYNGFSTSDRTNDYYEKLKDLEGSKPADFQSQYQADIDNIVNSILNRESFNTDDVFDSDLYNMYREQYINQGQKAMRDTMGNAAAMTGGYGSTYATAAGQQAYDNYLSQLNDKTLDIYDRVYNEYLQEGQELYNQLGMLNEQDSIDYGRYRDSVSDYYNDLNYYAGRYDSSYSQDFGEYQTDLAAQQWAEQYAYQKLQDELAQQNWQTQFDYQQEQDAQAQANWQAEFDYQKEQDAQQLALAYAKAKSSGSGGSNKSSKSSTGSQEENEDGYAPIAANVIEEAEKNNWTNTQAYNYVMQLGEEGRINQSQVDKILKVAGIDEDAALEELEGLKDSALASSKYMGYYGLLGLRR